MARVDFVSRKPINAGDVEFEFGFFLDARFDFFVKDFAFVLFMTLRKSAYNAPALFPGHWEKGDNTVFGNANMQRVVTVFPIDPNIGHVEQTLKRAAFK